MIAITRSLSWIKVFFLIKRVFIICWTVLRLTMSQSGASLQILKSLGLLECRLTVEDWLLTSRVPIRSVSSVIWMQTRGRRSEPIL